MNTIRQTRPTPFWASLLAGVMLIGIDTPSVDPFHSKELEAHQAFARNDMEILPSVLGLIPARIGSIHSGFF